MTFFPSDIIFCRMYVFILNGFGVYDSWTTIASLINLGTTLKYVSQVSELAVSNVCLSLLLIMYLIWFFMENTILDSKMRFLVTPYIGMKSVVNLHCMICILLFLFLSFDMGNFCNCF